MRTYKVTGMTCGGCETAVTRAIKRQLGDDATVEADAAKGEVRVTEPADPQIVSIAIGGAGYAVGGPVTEERSIRAVQGLANTAKSMAPPMPLSMKPLSRS